MARGINMSKAGRLLSVSLTMVFAAVFVLLSNPAAVKAATLAYGFNDTNLTWGF